MPVRRGNRWSSTIWLVLMVLAASACTAGPGPESTGHPTVSSAAPPPGASPAPSPSSPAPSAAPAPTATTVSATLLPAVMPAARYRTLGAAVGGDLYLLGGLDPGGVSSADVFRIDPASGTVAVAGHLATPTHGGAAVTVGNQVLVFGGADVSPDDLVQSFDPATGASSVIGHMPSARADLVGVLVGSQVVLLGGFNGSTFVTDVWATAGGTTFSVLGQVAQPERYPAVAVVGTTIYLFGGLLAGGEYNGTESTAVQSFDVATGRGAVIGHLPEPLAHARAATVGGQVLLFGGWTSAGASAAVWRFDPATGAVTPVGTLPEAVADEAIGVVTGTVYFASGLGAAERPLTAIGSLRLGP